MATLSFDQDTHVYAVDGLRVPGVTDIVGYLQKGGFGVQDAIIYQAARRGTAVHEYCELIDYGAVPDLIESDLCGYVRAYQAFLRDYRPDWTHIEKPLYSVDYGFAGTTDRYGRIGGKRTLVDLKSNSSFNRLAKIKLACQLSGYERLEVESGNPVDSCIGVQLHKDGKYTIHDQRDIEKKYRFHAGATFLSLLEITKIAEGYQ